MASFGAVEWIRTTDLLITKAHRGPLALRYYSARRYRLIPQIPGECIRIADGKRAEIRLVYLGRGDTGCDLLSRISRSLRERRLPRVRDDYWGRSHGVLDEVWYDVGHVAAEKKGRH